MEKSIQQVIQESGLILKSDLQTVLATYDHISLTQEEVMEAMIWAKQKKQAANELRELKIREDQNRRMLTQTKFTYEQTRLLMRYRADNLFQKPFIIDKDNEVVFELLCYYFSDDPMFIAKAAAAGIQNPSLEKGILLVGEYGTGKTWMMKLFMKNQRQVFFMRHAKEMANEYQNDGGNQKTYIDKFKNAINDSSLFYHEFSGLCIDDIGTEDSKKNYGNTKNVIGDIMELRYKEGNGGIFLHGTTNLSVEGIEDKYGTRLRSRMREMFNYIVLTGGDRRK